MKQERVATLRAFCWSVAESNLICQMGPVHRPHSGITILAVLFSFHLLIIATVEFAFFVTAWDEADTFVELFTTALDFFATQSLAGQSLSGDNVINSVVDSIRIIFCYKTWSPHGWLVTGVTGKKEEERKWRIKLWGNLRNFYIQCTLFNKWILTEIPLLHLDLLGRFKKILSGYSQCMGLFYSIVSTRTLCGFSL